ncbi:MAG: helix-turn-helix domain-containing protein, partial [Candidatus Omnitrophica bacterium]|nr:helix-turn-helix domain-containing protein [Candidatus Omnitrophota bacterium]
MAAFQTNYISTAELARFLGISRVAVLKRIQKGAIPAVKIGRAYAIPETVVSEYFPKYKTRVPEAPDHVSVLEAARILRVSRFAISKRIERGQMEARRVGRRYVISKESIDVLKQQLAKEIVTDKEYLSIPEYARLLQVSRIAIYKKVKKGLLKARKIGRHYVIDVKGGASVGPD